MNQYEISIVVPVTRMAGKLRNLKSWLSEVHGNAFEIIILHDYRDEQTGRELRQIIAAFPNLRILFSEEEYGSPGIARNAGIAQANGKWITFWDADDVGHPDVALKAISEFPDSRAIVCGYQTSTFDKDLEEPTKHLPNSQICFYLASAPGLWRFLFQADVINDQSFLDFEMGEDQVFLVNLHLVPDGITIYPKIVYTYYKNVEGQLTSVPKNQSSTYKAFFECMRILKYCNTREKEFSYSMIFKLYLSTIKHAPFKRKTSATLALLNLVVSSKFQFLITICRFLNYLRNKREKVR